MKKGGKYFGAGAAFLAVCFIAIMSFGISSSAGEQGEKITISMIGKYDSADTAAIRSVDIENKLLRLRNHNTGKTYTLNYDNTSMMYDVRGTVLSASLLEPGQIVDVTFLKSSKHITTLNVSGNAWTIESTREHDLVRGDGSARVKDETYRIDDRTLVMADGELALAEDILATDSVTVSGIGKEIYSVVVTGGHGYVSLSSDMVDDQSLVGAWLELDNEVIHKISPNMLLSAPEGEYNLQILGNGANYQSEINISRNEETVIDTSNIKVEKPSEGIVTFQIIPEYAEVFVDGERVLSSIQQSFRYGYHNLKVMADGYVTQDKYLKIGSPSSVINIELEPLEDSSESSMSTSGISLDITYIPTGSSEYTSTSASFEDTTSAASSSSSSKKKSSTSASSYKRNRIIEDCRIYFDSPEDAELYFDGAYIGIVPVSVSKISGIHEVILKRDGYETKSYRISIDTEETDETYTFPELLYSDDLITKDITENSSGLSETELVLLLESAYGISPESLFDEETGELMFTEKELLQILETLQEASTESISEEASEDLSLTDEEISSLLESLSGASASSEEEQDLLKQILDAAALASSSE
ncbi:MAG: PEGA domain-containing protein [Butyrivibrio sp.]|nr:PEGA domain-containing protein [Butyrivibrio sp.]